MSAQHIYNDTPSFIIDGCKHSKENLNQFVQHHNFDSRQAEIFTQLIASDGKYTWDDNMVPNTNQLIQKRVKQQNIRAIKINAKQPKQSQPKEHSSKIDISKYHPKLRQWSCLQNPTNGAISKSHQKLADFMNENIDLDKISNEDFESIITKLNKIVKDINYVKDRMKLKHMENIETYNVKKEIELKIGTSEITHKVDEICHFFVLFDKEYEECMQKLKTTQTFINDVIIQLDLGYIHVNDNGKKIIKPNLSCNKYSYNSGNIKAVIKGENMYNFLKNKKKDMNKLKKCLNKHQEKIKKDRAHKSYQKYMKKKKKGKFMTEKDRSLRYSNGSAQKYQNQIKSGKKSRKKDNQKNSKSIKKKKPKKRDVEPNQLRMDSFFKVNNNNNNNNNNHNKNIDNNNNTLNEDITKSSTPSQLTQIIIGNDINKDNKEDKNVIFFSNMCCEESMLLLFGYIRNNFRLEQIACDVINFFMSFVFGCTGFDLEAFIFSRMNTQIGCKNAYYGFQILSSYLTNEDVIHLQKVNKLCYKVLKATKPVFDTMGFVISTPYIHLLDDKANVVIDKNGFTVCGGFKALNIHQLGLENIYVELKQKKK
eukprot:96008_1